MTVAFVCFGTFFLSATPSLHAYTFCIFQFIANHQNATHTHTHTHTHIHTHNTHAHRHTHTGISLGSINPSFFFRRKEIICNRFLSLSLSLSLSLTHTHSSC